MSEEVGSKEKDKKAKVKREEQRAKRREPVTRNSQHVTL